MHVETKYQKVLVLEHTVSNGCNSLDMLNSQNHAGDQGITTVRTNKCIGLFWKENI